MRSSSMTVRTVLSTLSIFSALLWACSETHSPQVGDTNTSWLHVCESESDCNRGARCISHLCTLPCEATIPNSCEQISEAATCDLESRACDVSCSADQDCRALGANFRCEASRCRPLPELSLSEETLGLASAEDLGVSEPYVFRTQTFWLKDHFRIGTTFGAGVATSESSEQSWSSEFVVSDVFPDGRVERHFLPNDRDSVQPTSSSVRTAVWPRSKVKTIRLR